MKPVSEPTTHGQGSIARRAGHDRALVALGWQTALVGRTHDRPIARAIIATFGLVLGASSGLFLGSVLGVIAALALLPLSSELALLVVLFTTISCASAGAVVGPRILQRETFDEVC